MCYFRVFADGGDRTHTLLPVLDFESSASASSATSAFMRRQLLIRLQRNASAKEHAVADLFRRPGSVFCNERVGIVGELVQDRQIFARSYVPQGDADVSDEAWLFKTFNR